LRKTSFGKIDVLGNFPKVKFNSQNQVQFNPKDVPVGLSIQTEIKQVKRNILESPDWSPSVRNKKRRNAKLGAARLSDRLPVSSGLARLELAQATNVQKLLGLLA